MSKLNVLIVEDNKLHLEMIYEGLKENLPGDKSDFPYNISGVDSCFKAIDYLNSNKVDLIILDLNLGDRTDVEGGFEVLEKVNACSPSTGVIVFTAHGSVETCRRAFFNNVSEFIEKPISELLTTLYIKVKLVPVVVKLIAVHETTRWNKYKESLKTLGEDQLINEVLIPLLHAMGFRDVERTTFHGPKELGKDIKPFYCIGPFGERIYYAAQVKAGNVDATSGSKNNVIKLVEQIETILATKFTDPITNTRRNVDKALAIVSGDFSGDAQQIISEKYEGNANVMLISGDRILNLLNGCGIINMLLKSTDTKGRVLETVKTNKFLFLSVEIEGKPPNADVLRYVSDLLCEKGHVYNNDDTFKSLFARECLGSTGVGAGYAVPHIQLDSLSETIIVLCIAKEGVNWDSLDKKDSKIVCISLFHSPLIRMSAMMDICRYFKKLASLEELYDKQEREKLFRCIDEKYNK